jgi:heme iron utilization protein
MAACGQRNDARYREETPLAQGEPRRRQTIQTGDPADTFDGAALAKRLLRTIRSGALATLDALSGHPFASLVTVATDIDGSPLLLMSTLSAHRANLEADPRVSILLSQQGKGDPLAHPRLTVIGRAGRSSDAQVRSRFIARHPKAKLYADFADFAFFRLAVEGAHLNGGFARAMSLTSEQLLCDRGASSALVEAHDGAVAHMNEDHRDALRLYATRLAGARDGDWRMTGIDPEGIDLARGDETARILFSDPLSDPNDIRAKLVALVAAARGKETGQ